MIIKNNLSIVTGFDFNALHVIFQLFIGVHVNLFTVPLVSEDEALLSITGVDFKVGGVVGVASIGAPVKITQVGGFGEKFLLAVEVEAEVFGF